VAGVAAAKVKAAASAEAAERTCLRSMIGRTDGGQSMDDAWIVMRKVVAVCAEASGSITSYGALTMIGAQTIISTEHAS
jgi:hypothetical protein